MKVLLQEIRKSQGLSQNDLARRTGMSPQNIQKIEQGEAKSLTFRTLGLFCQALNCQPGDILVYEDDPDSNGDPLIQPSDSLLKSKVSPQAKTPSNQASPDSSLLEVVFIVPKSA
ncbi:MAG: helix-turn-helix transcriptional regulator [Crocosphaera sp.]|nr:helix-turn-helix transcriptional regulator [Crocosphaera sp.]